MWIKTTGGRRVNLDHVTRLASHSEYNKMHSVRAYFPGIAFWPAEEYRVEDYDSIAEELSPLEAEALMDDLLVLAANGDFLADAASLLDDIRHDIAPKTQDDTIFLTEQGRALLGEEDARQLDKTRMLDENGEAR